MLEDTLVFGEKDSRLEYTKREGCYAVIINVNHHHVAAILTTRKPLLQVGNFFMARFVKKVQEPIDDDHDLKWIRWDEVDEMLFHEHHAWAVKQAVALLRSHR